MILVAGATGYLGGMIARSLLARGEDVRVLVRPQSNYQPLVEAGARPVFADLKDRASLDAACDGIAAVITTANSSLRGGDDNPQTVDLQGNRNLIDAAKAAGVGQFIFISAIGVDVNSPSPFMQAKAHTEAYLRESGLPYTILAPTPFMDVWVSLVIGGPLQAGQPVTLVGEGYNRHAFIAVADVAAFAVAALGHPAARNRHLPLGGPEALSWRAIIALVEREIGHAIPVRSIPIGDPVPGMPDVVVGLMTNLATTESIIDMAETAATFGVRQTPLAVFVRQAFGVERAVAG